MRATRFTLTSVVASAALLLSGAVAAAPAYAVTCPTVAVDGTVTPKPSYGADWSGCDLTGASLAFASLGGMNLSNAKLAGADLSITTISSTDLTGADLTGADLTAAYLTRVVLTGANLTSAVLDGVRGNGLTSSPSTLLPSAWSVTTGYLVGPTANLVSARLDGVDLGGRDLADATLAYASLAGADLSGTNLHRALLVGAGLVDATVSSTTDLGAAELAGVRSGDVHGSTTLLPVSWFVAGGHLLGNGADLSGSDLRGLPLAGRSLRGASLAGARLSGTDLSGTDLAAADLRYADMTGPHLDNASLTDAQLGGASLSGASVRSADLSRADLTGAWLVGADLTGATVVGVDLTRTFLDDASFRSAVFGGAGASFDSASVQRTDFRDATGLETVPAPGVDWSTAVCPDGVVGALHIGASCQQPVETKAVLVPLPAVSVNGSKQYITLRAMAQGTDYSYTRFRVRSQNIVTGAWSSYSYWTWGGTAPTWDMQIARGRRYCISVQAVRADETSTAYSPESCTTVPIDDDSMVASGAWQRDPSYSGRYFWYSRSLSTAVGASLATRVSLKGRTVAVVATTCSGCGSVAVYVGSTKVGTVSLASSTTRYQKVLLVPLSSTRSGAVKLVVTTSGKKVQLDGVAMLP